MGQWVMGYGSTNLGGSRGSVPVDPSAVHTITKTGRPIGRSTEDIDTFGEGAGHIPI